MGQSVVLVMVVVVLVVVGRSVGRSAKPLCRGGGVGVGGGWMVSLSLG